MKYITTTFSPSMIKEGVAKIKEISEEEALRILGDDFESAVGHENTAKLLSLRTNKDIKFARINLSLSPGDRVIAAIPQFRAPEGSREFTQEEIENAKFRWFVIDIVSEEEEGLGQTDLRSPLRGARLRLAKEGREFTDPGEAYLYAVNVVKGRVEEAEPVIATDPYWAYVYARDVIKGRFEEGEDAIAKDAKYSFYYARDVLKGRFEKGEDAIAKDPDIHELYKDQVLKGRFEKGEDVVVKPPKGLEEEEGTSTTKSSSYPNQSVKSLWIEE